MGLYRFGVLSAAASLSLLVVGALVSSGAVPQQVHQALGALVGLLTLGLLIWIWRAERRAWLRWLALAAFVLVVLQGMLGGVTTLYGFSAAVSILHACAAQLFFALLAAIVVATSPAWQADAAAIEESGQPSLRALAFATSTGILAQVGLGAAFRHGALGIAPHVIGAVVVTSLVVLLSVIVLTQYTERKGVTKPARRLLIVTLHQVALGVLAYLVGMLSAGGLLAASATAAHVAVGALTLAASVILSIQIARNVHTRVAVA